MYSSITKFIPCYQSNCSINSIDNKQQSPIYPVPKKGIVCAIGTIALLIFAIISFTLPIPIFFSGCLALSSLSFSIATAIDAKIAFEDSRSLAEYEYGTSILDTRPEEGEKWLEKSGFNCFNRTVTKALSENGIDTDKKYLAVCCAISSPFFKQLTLEQQAKIITLKKQLK